MERHSRRETESVKADAGKKKPVREKCLRASLLSFVQSVEDVALDLDLSPTGRDDRHAQGGTSFVS